MKIPRQVLIYNKPDMPYVTFCIVELTKTLPQIYATMVDQCIRGSTFST